MTKKEKKAKKRKKAEKKEKAKIEKIPPEAIAEKEIIVAKSQYEEEPTVEARSSKEDLEEGFEEEPEEEEE